MLKRLIYLQWVKELINCSQDLILDCLSPRFYVLACAYSICPTQLFHSTESPLTSAGQTDHSASGCRRGGLSTLKRACDPWWHLGWEKSALFLSESGSPLPVQCALYLSASTWCCSALVALVRWSGLFWLQTTWEIALLCNRRIS